MGRPLAQLSEVGQVGAPIAVRLADAAPPLPAFAGLGAGTTRKSVLRHATGALALKWVPAAIRDEMGRRSGSPQRVAASIELGTSLNSKAAPDEAQVGRVRSHARWHSPGSGR